MKNVFWIVIVMMVLPLQTADAALKPKTHVGAQAPSQQDYYSTADKNISDADRRKANQIRQQTIESIKALLAQKNVKGSRRFELLLRLGELYSEGHDFVRDEEEKAFDEAQKSWIANNRKSAEPKLSTKRSRTQLANAAESFRKLVREFPREPRTAAALYSLGKTLARLEDDGSVMYFEQLIKNHKKSPLVADAYLSMGEFYFDKHNIPKAMDAYKNFLKFKDHVAYSYGVYKLGWAFYNATPKNDQEAQDNLDKAVTSFKLTIKLADVDKRRKISRLDLRSEAIKDLVMVWAETENTEAAWAYFKTIGEKTVFYDLLERLGNIYFDQGKNAKAADVYARLVDEAPSRENTPKIYERLLGIYDALGKTQKVVDTLTTMNKLFVKGSPWTNKYANQKTLLSDAKTMVEFDMRRYGTLFHQRGQKTNTRAYIASASQIYSAFLESFPNSKDAYEIRYYFADTLLEFQKYESASDQYVLVVDADKNGKYLKDSAMNAVVAMNKVDQAATYPKLPPAGQAPKALNLPRTKAKLINVLDKYVTALPDDKAGYPMRFTAAQTYFDYGNYEEAMKRFSSIINTIPNTKQAEVSLKILLAYQAERKDWDKTISMAQGFLSNKRLSKEMREFVSTTMRNAMFNQALALEKDEKFEAAAKSFVAIHKEFGSDKGVADKALFNASVNYYKAGMLEDAIAVNVMLIEKHPDSNLVPQSMLTVGQTYEALGQYQKAASYYRQYAFTYPKDKLASRALYNAGSLYKGFDQPAEAEKLLTRFVQMYPYNNMADQVRLDVAKLQEGQGQMKSAIATYKVLADAKDKELALVGMAKVGVLSAAQGSTADVQKYLSKARTELKAKDAPAAVEARRLVAEAMFKESEALFNNTKQMKINSAKTLEGDVGRKQRNLEVLARRYKDIMSFESSEYSVASLYRLGELHEDLAEKLFAVAPPEGASQVDVSQFKTSIEKVAFPLRDEAYKFYETAFKQSQEVETFTAWTRKTYDKMAELAPDKNPAVLEIEAEPNYLVHKLSMEDSVAPLAH